MIAPRNLAPDRHALVAHLVTHLAYSTSMVRVVSRLSAAADAPAMRLAMGKVLPVLQDEYVMLRALIESIGGDGGARHDGTRDVSRRERSAAVASTEGRQHDAASDAVTWTEWTAPPEGAGATMAEALDELLVGCWGRYAIWRALAGRCQPDDVIVRPEFDALAQRSQHVICELELLQEGVVSHC